VADKEKAYTKAELRRAKEAAEMIRNSGFTSERDAVNLVQDNNVEDVHVTATFDMLSTFMVNRLRIFAARRPRRRCDAPVLT
jgi:hypothetical protein